MKLRRKSRTTAATRREEPHVRDVRAQRREIRLKGKAGIARALYVTAKEQRVVIARAFVKESEKTPSGEVDLHSRGQRN